jgi:hypothetical protein
VAMATDAAEERSFRNASGALPSPHGTNQAGGGIRAIRNIDVSSLPLGIGFQPPESDDQSVVFCQDVFAIQRCQLRTAEPSGKPSSSSARSRQPARLSGRDCTMRRTSAVSSGALVF